MTAIGFRVGQWLLAAGLALWVVLLVIRLVTRHAISAPSVYLLAAVTGLVVCGLAVIASFPWYPVPAPDSPQHGVAQRRITLSRGLVWGGAVLLETGILLTLPFTGAPSLGVQVVPSFLAAGGLLVLAGLENLRRLGVQVHSTPSAA
ncbi:MAG: hypothetical protein WA688_09365 [Thermoplasmata archaeon]